MRKGKRETTFRYYFYCRADMIFSFCTTRVDTDYVRIITARYVRIVQDNIIVFSATVFIVVHRKKHVTCCSVFTAVSFVRITPRIPRELLCSTLFYACRGKRRIHEIRKAALPVKRKLNVASYLLLSIYLRYIFRIFFVRRSLLMRNKRV